MVSINDLQECTDYKSAALTLTQPLISLSISAVKFMFQLLNNVKFNQLARWHCDVATFMTLSNKTWTLIVHALKSISHNFH